MVTKKEIEKEKSLPSSEGAKEILTSSHGLFGFLISKRIEKLIDEVLNRLSDKNASQISEYSHGVYSLES